MSINVEIQDGRGTNSKVKVSDEGVLNVVEHPHPPLNESIYPLPFRARFVQDGTSISNMNVNGSSTPIEYCVCASNDYDLYIKTTFVEIEDSGTPTLNKFGALTALTNGVEFIYYKQDFGDYQLHDGIKTNKEFIRLGIDTHGIGTGTEAYLADVSGGGTSKSYLPIIDWGEMCGMRYGIRLAKGSKDKLIFRIKDNLTGLVTFDAIAYGIRI